MNEEIPSEASYIPTLNGDLLSYVNLLRFIRDFGATFHVGDFQFIEFGVLNGTSIINSIRQLRGPLKSVVGFDTFCGIPELTIQDADPEKLSPTFYQGNFHGLEKVQVQNLILKATRFPINQLNLVEGDFRNSLDNFKINNSLFPLIFHLDCDIFSSSLKALQFVADNAQNGSWLLCDDYWMFRGHPKMGQQKAIELVFKDHPRVFLTPYSNYNGYSRAFIINLK
jgi:hypothetical protein